MDNTQVLYVGTAKSLIDQAQTTYTFNNNVGWLMNVDPSTSEIVIGNSFQGFTIWTNTQFTTSPLSDQFISTQESITYSQQSKTWAEANIVEQIPTKNKKTIIPSTVPDQEYNVYSTLIFDVPAFTLLETCTDVVFTYSCTLTQALDQFITFTPSNRRFVITSIDPTIAGVYYLKITGKINNDQSETITIKLTVNSECKYSSITANSQFDVSYIINSGPSTFSLNSFSTNTTQCPITYTLTKIGISSTSNFLVLIETPLSIRINTQTPSDEGVYIYELRGKNSIGSLGQAIQFRVAIKSECASDVITSQQIQNQIYYIESGTPILKFSLAWSHTMSSCGTIQYQIVNQADNSTADSIFYLQDNQFYVNTSDVAKMEEYFLRIIGQNAYVKAIRDFQISITTNCPYAVITPTQTLPDRTYNLGSQKVIFSFQDWSISEINCGPLTYSLLVDDQIIFNNGIQFDPFTREISYYATDNSIIGRLNNIYQLIPCCSFNITTNFTFLGFNKLRKYHLTNH
ncbi:UNKNOWN [Stylonychia lemnae]|uniref:Cadg domain containing protein n=1 Tax=Stylonychia lemnae TaxID=5949 RepID=A0A078APX9_STYLE|nr:UNKNOWN [Stylonychia lemnae]|eukprot:CDW83347.1 UNKNOWN [Stylonychia lemnae]